MKFKTQNFTNFILLKKYKTIHNTRKICNLVGITNLISCLLFFYLFISFQYFENISKTQYFLIVPVIFIHLYLNSVLINWSLDYENATWIRWAWASLVSALPIGIILIYIGLNENIWKNVKNIDRKNNKAFHSFTNSFINLNHIFDTSIDYLLNNHGKEFNEVIKNSQLDLNEKETWDNKIKYVVIALCEALKQTKKKNTFEDIQFHAHWYDRRFFDFAILDPKSKIIPNRRYKYSFGFIVLDEFNNYQKILEGKQEIKRNMKFGPAKAVCLHWGKGFKIFVNE